MTPAILTDLAKIAPEHLSYHAEFCHRGVMTDRLFFVESAQIRPFGSQRAFTSEPCQPCQPTCHLVARTNRPK
ncbi:hypothetical protein [Novosphingobium sp. KA1]|uniref:hypothetical protein n=1 Tax=Novosphingobium sp. (strain KA1) TaxID=164608 RepID=UPI001A8D66A6|nr:hypothetical protein [Novosphingobium sp. KA1]